MTDDLVDAHVTALGPNDGGWNAGQAAERGRNLDTVRRWLALLEAEDIEAWKGLWASEARQDMPYAPPAFPKSFDRDRLFEQYDGLPQAYDYMRYPELELFETQDPKVVIARFHGDIQLKDNAGRYDNRYVSFFVFDPDGKVVRVIEHFNPLVLMEGGAFGEGGRPQTGDGAADGSDAATTKSREDWARSFFATIDSGDLEEIAARFAPDIRLAMGNGAASEGREAAREAFGQMAGTVKSTRHDILGVWRGSDADIEVVSVEANVTYTLADRDVTVPVTSTLRLRDGLVTDYRIFIDTTPVFGPTEGRG
jgi:uncharacterized protein